MKHFVKTIIVRYLRRCAIQKLKRWHPVVIAITGSVGKTTTKEIIAHLLSVRFSVKKTEGNYNTEIGLPLAILDVRCGTNIFSWIRILWQSFFRVFFPDAHAYFVAEMGADKPGDIRYLVSIIKPHISVVTNVARVHVAHGQFGNEKDIQREKSELVRCLSKQDIAVLNADNVYVRDMAAETRAQVLWYGYAPDADMRIQSMKSTEKGFMVTLKYKGTEYAFEIPFKGDFLLYAFVPAIVIAFLQGISSREIQERINSFRLPKGRFNFITGIRGSLLVDSSYNASPYAVREALRSFHAIPGKRKVVVLGSMNELGEYSEQEHRAIGKLVANECHTLVTVGQDAQWIAEEATTTNPYLSVHPCSHYEEASVFLQGFLQESDIVLFKGSQNQVFLEEVVKSVMLHPEQASELLVRQGSEWLGKKRYRKSKDPLPA